MPEKLNSFIIVGPDNSIEDSYYNVNGQWVQFDDASRFPKEIMEYPLPTGSVGVMEINTLGEFVTYYALGQGVSHK